MTVISGITFPLLLRIEKNYKGKVRAIDTNTGIDCTRMVVYVTLQGAFKKGKNIYKHSEDVSFVSVDPSFEIGDPVPTAKHRKTVGHLKKRDVKPPVKQDMQVNIISTENMPWLTATPPSDIIISDVKWRYLIRTVYKGGNIMITGPSGSGKSMTAIAAAIADSGDMRYWNLGSTQDPRATLIGNTHFNKETGTFFNRSPFIKAISTPGTRIVLDEISRAHPEAHNILMTALDANLRHIRLDEDIDAPVITVAKGVSFIASANIGTEYTATRQIDRALIDRFKIIEMDVLTREQEISLMVMKYPQVPIENIEIVASILEHIRTEMNSNSPRISTAVSTRSGIEIISLLADGFKLSECLDVIIYPLYSAAGGAESERVFVKQLVQGHVPIEAT